MLEAEGRLAGEAPAVGLDELLAHERAQVRVELGPVVAAVQLEHGRASERSPDHRGGLDHGALARVEPVEARRQQGVDGGQDSAAAPRRPSCLQVVLVDEHAHQLLDEQRVALGAAEDPVGEIGGHAGVAEQVLDERAALGAAQRLELDPRGAGTPREVRA